MGKQVVGPDGFVPVKIPKKQQAPDEGYAPLPTDDPDAQPPAEQGEKEQDEANSKKSRKQESCGEKLLENNVFQSLMALLIMANALVIGMETDIEWKHWDSVENLFLLLFTIELSMKICILGPFVLYSVYHPDFHWSVFDLFIVGLGLFDFAMTTLGGASLGGFATLFRIIRLLRIMRIFRIIKFLKQLYLLAFGLVEATKAIFWVSVLMSFILYVTSIVLVKTIGRPPESDPHYEFMNYKFGSIIESMLSLFVLMSSPNLPVYQDEVGLLAEKPVFCIFLILFITFGSFGIIAMLTGVISESMFEKNEMRKQEAREEHEEMRLNLGTHCAALFMTTAIDGGDTAHVNEVAGLAPKLVHMLELAGGTASVNDIEELVHNMYTDDKGNIKVTEFVETLEKVADGLSPFSIQEIEHAVGNLHKDVVFLQTSVNDMMSVVTQIASRTENGGDPILPQSLGQTTAIANLPKNATIPQTFATGPPTEVRVNIAGSNLTSADVAANPNASEQTSAAGPIIVQSAGLAETLLASIANLISEQTLAINRSMEGIAASHERTLKSLGGLQQVAQCSPANTKGIRGPVEVVSYSRSLANAKVDVDGAESIPVSSLAKHVAMRSTGLSFSQVATSPLEVPQVLAPTSQGAAPIGEGGTEEHHLERLLDKMTRTAKQRRTSPAKMSLFVDEVASGNKTDEGDDATRSPAIRQFAS